MTQLLIVVFSRLHSELRAWEPRITHETSERLTTVTKPHVQQYLFDSTRYRCFEEKVILTCIVIGFNMGILHSVFRRHSVHIVPKTFPPLQRAPDPCILWPNILLEELQELSIRLEAQAAVGKMLSLAELYRLKSLLHLRKLRLDVTLRQRHIARVQSHIDFYMTLWRIQQAVLDRNRRALNTGELEAATNIVELALEKRGKRPRRTASSSNYAKRASFY